MVKKIFRVPEMHCPSCVMRIEGLEDEIAGISRISASYHKQQVVIEYDEAQVNTQKILEALKSLGYQAELV